MTAFLDVFAFSLSVTGPIFIILALGVLLMRVGLLTDAFVATGSRLVFTIGLPALLFLSVSRARLEETAYLGLVLFGAAGTVVAYVLFEWLATKLVDEERDRGVVVQGAFRSNMGIIGLAFCINAYGDAGLPASSLYVGVVTILVNVLAVITLNRSLHRSQGIRHMARGIVGNPLIIAIVLGLLVSWLEIGLPKVALQAGRYLGDLALPLALLCTGASLDFKRLRDEPAHTVLAAAGKLVLFPLVIVLSGIAIGFRGMELGVLMLMTSAPTAAASYVMVRAMGGNAPLAANIIAVTTLGSLLTTSIGIMVLRSLLLM